MLNYADWIRRAVEFTQRLRRLSGSEKVEIDVAPPLSELEVDELARTCRLPIPETLQRFWTQASGHCHCTYHLNMPASFQHQFAVAFDDRHQSHLRGGAEFDSANEIAELTLSFPSWADLFRRDGYPMDARLWDHSIPLIPAGDGDCVGLYLRDDTADPPVAYLCHEGCGASSIISRNLDEFLINWERLGYIGVSLIGSFVNRNSGYLDPDAFPVETEAALSILRGEVRSDLLKPQLVMSEGEWMTSVDPNTMMQWLEREGRQDERKLRLFCCACCRRNRVWDQMGEWSRKAVDVAERFADGDADQAEYDAAWTALSGGERGRELKAAMHIPFEAIDSPAFWDLFQLDPAKAIRQDPWKDLFERSGNADAEAMQFWKTEGLMHHCAHGAMRPDPLISDTITEHLDEPESSGEKAAHAELIRHIFGNPFRHVGEPGVRASHIVELAMGLYEQTTSSMQLHAALKEAGHDILAEHFVDPSHPKGCWALDLILEK